MRKLFSFYMCKTSSTSEKSINVIHHINKIKKKKHIMLVTVEKMFDKIQCLPRFKKKQKTKKLSQLGEEHFFHSHRYPTTSQNQQQYIKYFLVLGMFLTYHLLHLPHLYVWCISDVLWPSRPIYKIHDCIVPTWIR